MGNAATPALTDLGGQGAQVDANFQVTKRLAWAFAPHEQATPNMTVRLDAGAVFDGTTLTEVAAQNTAAISAPTTNPRIDRVVVDRLTGAVSVATGTEAASPVAPAIPTGKVPVAQVLLQTSSTAITNTMITDERAIGALSAPLAGDPPITIPTVGKLPTALSGYTPKLWFRADQRKAMIAEDNGDGGKVCGWGNIVGQFVQYDPSLQVTNAGGLGASFKAADPLVNNQPTIHCDSTWGVLQVGAIPQTMPIHVFLVGRVFGGPQGPTFGGAVDNFDLYYCMGTDTVNTFGQINTAGNAYVNKVNVPSGAHLWEAFFNGTTTSYMRLDRGTKVTGAAAGRSGTGINIGGLAGSGAQTNVFAEIITFDSSGGGEVTGTAYTDLTNYLGNRYGITLP